MLRMRTLIESITNPCGGTKSAADFSVLLNTRLGTPFIQAHHQHHHDGDTICTTMMVTPSAPPWWWYHLHHHDGDTISTTTMVDGDTICGIYDIFRLAMGQDVEGMGCGERIICLCLTVCFGVAVFSTVAVYFSFQGLIIEDKFIAFSGTLSPTMWSSCW